MGGRARALQLQREAEAQAQAEALATQFNSTAKIGSTSITGNTKAQSAVIFDAISEGPIEGLKFQAASIKLNGDRVYSLGGANTNGVSGSSNASYNATTGVITDHNSPGFMKDASTAEGTRKVLIVGGKKTGNATTVAGNNTITSVNLNFATDDVPESDQIVPSIRIAGAGQDGADYAAKITRRINTAAVEVDFAPAANVTNATASIDLVKTIQSYDTANNKVTVASPSGLNINNGKIVMSTPTEASDFIPSAKYHNFGFSFRTGESTQERGQTYIPTPQGVGSAGVAYQVPSGDLKQVPNTGYPSGQDLGITIDGSTPNPQGSAVVVTATEMGISDPGEVDMIKLTVNFPGGLIIAKEDGALRDQGAEFRVRFDYSRDGGASFTSETVIGRNVISSNKHNYIERYGTYKYDTNGGTISAKTQQQFNHILAFETEQFQPFDDYRIAIERVSFDSGAKNTKWTQTSVARLSTVENIITDKLNYPYTAIGAVIVGANEFSAIPARSYEIRGLKVKVPTNYFPKDEHEELSSIRRTTAAYTRNVTTGADTNAYVDWDGNFRGDKKVFSSPTHVNHEPVYTNNPVWIFMDLLTNPRYGLGKYIDPDFDFTQIDKYSLYTLAKYCDELVPDGQGGTEPRFTCNAYISRQSDALKILKDFATTMRAMLLWQDGAVGLGANIQKGAVYTFNKTNVLDGVFAYNGVSNRTKCNQVKVTWNNPNNSYKQEVSIVEDTDQIAIDGKIKTKSVTAFGCTSRSQAIRYGKWHLFSSKLETEMIQFGTGLNGAMLRPGEVINVADSDREGVVTGGRVTSTAASTTTIIRTDRDLSLYLNQTAAYKLHLIYPEGGAYLSQPSATINSTNYFQGDLILLDEDGNAIDTEAKAANVKDDSGNTVVTYWSNEVRVETQTVSSYNATSVTVASAFSSAPSSEVVYSITGEDEQGSDLTGSMKQYMITSIKEDSDDLTFAITGAEYDISKFDIIDRGYVLEEESEMLTPPPFVDVPKPSNLVLTLNPETTDSPESKGTSRLIENQVLVQWSPPKSTRVNDEGDAVDDVYEFLSHYEIYSNLYGRHIKFGGSIREVDGDDTSYLIERVLAKGRGFVKIRTVNTSGHKSDWVMRTIQIDGRIFVSSDNTEDGGLNGAVTKGGVLTTTMDINSSNGTVTLANNTYTFQPPGSTDPVLIASGNTNFTSQTFSGLADGETAFLYFDYDGSLSRGTTREDVLQPVILSTDTTATDASGNKLNFSYLKRLGESNEDFTQISGTVTSTANSPEVIGTGTTFENEYEAGDLIILGAAGTTRHIATVGSVDSNTALTISKVSTRAFSGVNAFRQNLRIDNSKDCIIARVSRSGSTYSLVPFTNKQKADEGEIGDGAVTSVTIAANAIDGTKVAANAIDTAQIAGNAITVTQIQANSIGSAQISAGSIGQSEIAANSIGSAEIVAGAVGSSEIAANSIGSAQISAGSIGSSEIAANSIGTAAISAGSITSSEIAANAIGTAAISANTITAAQLTSDAVGSFTVTANSITAVELASNSVDSAQIAANSIASAEISANSIGSSEITANSVNGTIIAGNSVSGTQIAANSVNGIILSSGAVDSAAKLANNVVNASKILSGAVAAQQLAANAVTSAKIAVNSVNTSELISDAVTGDIIAANAVDTAQIKANSIGSAAIIAGSIGSSEMAANSIGTANIVADAIDSSHISANSIGSTAIVANAIGQSEISANSITTNAIVADAIDSSHIAANSIDSNAIVADAIDSSHIAVNSINSNMIVAGTIDSSHIGANSITAAAVVAGSITNSEIAGNTINSAVIQAGAVTNPQIGANAITSAKIAAGAVDTAEIAADAITTAKIAANAIGTAEISSSASIGFAQITGVAIDAAQIAANAITAAKIAAGAVDTAEIAANAIENAKISSTSQLTLTVTGGTAGGWTLNSSALSTTGVVIDSANRRIVISD